MVKYQLATVNLSNRSSRCISYFHQTEFVYEWRGLFKSIFYGLENRKWYGSFKKVGAYYVIVNYVAMVSLNCKKILRLRKEINGLGRY